MHDIWHKHLEHIEGLHPSQTDARLMDVLCKLGALVKQWETSEKSGPDIDYPKIFLENLEWLSKVLNEIDPEGLKVLAKNFDALIVRFKAEHAKTA